MQGLTISNRVAAEVSLKTEATLHFETMHAITYNRVKNMIETLHTPHQYASKVAGIAELLPLPIRIGLHGMMQQIVSCQPKEFETLQSVAALMGIKMEFNRWHYFQFAPAPGRGQIGLATTTEQLTYDRNVRKLIKRAQKIMLANPPLIHLNEAEIAFKTRLQEAINNRQPFVFTPVRG